MKIIINESALRYIINEFRTTIHSRDRHFGRFISEDHYDVIAASRKPPYETIVIGKFKIPQDAKTRVKEIFQKLENPLYTAHQDYALIIQLYEFRYRIADIKFNGNLKQQEQYKKMYYDRDNWRIFLQETPIPGDDEYNSKLSSGFVLFCIAHGDAISTLFLSRTKKFDYIKEKMMQNYYVHNVVYIDDFDNQIESYLDPDALRGEKPEEPQQQEPETEKPEEPISDKEKRLLAYKERMKRKFGKK